MESLTPYPTPSEDQDKVIRRVEIFANGLKKISKTMKQILYPVSFIPSKIKMKMTDKEWKRRVNAVPKDELQQPIEHAVYVANTQQAMDQNFFYILKNNRIWFKPIAAPKNGDWCLFGPDGLPPTGSKITKISSDGVNLIAIDQTRTVNYVHTNDINFFVTDDGWKIKKIKLDWTDRWLSIPIIKNIVGILKDNHLKLPEDCIAFGISQKGPETAYYTDMSGKKQPEFLVGVTTLYALTKQGRIFFADPWLANGFWNEITAPEDGQFVAEKMAVAASTIFLFRRDESGKMQMYTRFADFDSIGCNPLLPGTYNPNNRIPLIRRLPAEDWTKQPEIPLEKLAKVTSQISILQTGRGQNNRQLRVEGCNANGEPGYFYKNIYEKNWHFDVTPEQRLTFENVSYVSKPTPPMDMRGNFFTKKAVISLKNVELKKFLRHGLNERGLHTVIELTLNNGRILALPLYARRGLTHLFGQRKYIPDWKLVRPENFKLNEDLETRAALKTIFKNKKNISVKVNELENGDIEIYNKHRKFLFTFKLTPSYETTLLSRNKINSTSFKILKLTQPCFSPAKIVDKNEAGGRVHLYPEINNFNSDVTKCTLSMFDDRNQKLKDMKDLDKNNSVIQNRIRKVFS